MVFRTLDLRSLMLPVALALGCCAASGRAQEIPAAAAPANSATPTRLTQELDVPGAKTWTDTGIDLAVGETVLIESDGQVKYQSKFASPQGIQRSWTDLMRSLPVNGAGAGSLIGRIGEGESAIPFAIGAKKEVSVRRAGRFFLGLNQADAESSEGSFHAKVQVISAAAQAAEKKIEVSQEILLQIPRRIGDLQGNPGDMVNFMIIGSKEALMKTYAAEVATTNLRVNCFSPGPTRTRMRATAMPGEDPMTLPTPTARRQRRAQPLPVFPERERCRAF